MLKLSIFIFILVPFIIKSDDSLLFSIGNSEDNSIKKVTNDYIKILYNDFWLREYNLEKEEDRIKLFDWKDQRQKLLSNLTNQLNFDYPSIIQLFKTEQITYFKSLDNKNTTATSKRVQHMLRHYHPISLKKLKKSNLASKLDDIQNEQQYEIKNKVFHNVSYDFIDRNAIRRLVKLRYKLMLKNLMGKKNSFISFVEMFLQEKRVIAQLEIFEKLGINRYTNDTSFKKLVPPNLRILTKDDAYNKYLNLDETIYPGNKFEGLSDRLDDEMMKKISIFEVNTKLILGDRYEPLYGISKEIMQILFSNSSKSNADLILVNDYLERLKSWTFWFPKLTFNQNQWFVVEDEDELYSSIIPTDVNSTDAEKRLDRVIELWNEIENVSLNNQIDETKLKNVKSFQEKIKNDSEMLKNYLANNLGFNTTLSKFNDRFIDYYDSLAITNLIPLIEEQFRSNLNDSHQSLSKNKLKKKSPISTAYSNKNMLFSRMSSTILTVNHINLTRSGLESILFRLAT